MLIKKTYPLIFLFLLGISTLYGQSLYDTKTLLKNTSISVVWTPCWGPEFIDSSSNGAATLIDLGNYKYELQYTPNNNFTGSDTVSIEYLDFLPPTGKVKYKHYIFKVVKSYIELRPDYYQVNKDATDIEIEPLLNDSSSISGAGRLKINSLTATNFLRQASIQRDTVLKFSVDSGFVGLAKINYTACDSNSICQDASTIIVVIDTNNLVSDTVYVGTAEDLDVTVPLLQAGSIIASAPSHGNLKLDDYSVLYDPHLNYFGKDTFIIQKGNVFRSVFVEVYAQDEPNGFVVHDMVITSKDSTVYFNVRDNDLVKKYAILLDKGTNLGTLTKLNNNGDFKYVPKAGYEGVQTFSYKACPQGICEFGKVTIYIGNFEPQNTKTYKFKTPKNVPLKLDYQIPLDAYSFSATDTAVKYYPGFTTFTKTAHNGCTYTYTGYNQIIFTPGKDNGQGKHVFHITYCVSSTNQCHTVKCELDIFNEGPNCSKQCSGNCVWPGDIDQNGEVNMIDFLQVGYHLGCKGPSRSYNGNEYRALNASDWNMLLPNTNVDLKNCDTDGNGKIEAKDTTSVSNFYYQQHSLVPKQVYDRGDFPFELNVLTPNADSGDLALIEVVLGDSQYPVINLSGYAYNLDYNKDVVYEPSLEVDFYYQGWASQNASVLHLHKKPWDGRLESGFARGNALKVSGKGGTEVLKFIVEDNVEGFRGDDQIIPIPFYFSGIKTMNANGQIVELEDRVAYINLHRSKANTKSVLDEKKLLVFPNPTSEYITVHLNGLNTMSKAALLSINGSIVKEYIQLDPKHNAFGVSDIEPGIYLLRVETILGPITKKIDIIR